MTRTILLADDSVTAQNVGRRILTDAGYEVITVNNGSAALRKIRENHPDLVVLDIYMPGYGGLEVCQLLKESGDTMRIPVLLTVGKLEPFRSDDAKRVRADGHLVKPFDASELLSAMTRLEDRIVPQSDHGRQAQNPGEKPPQHGEVPAPASEMEWSEKIAYLAGAKNRQGQVTPSEAAEEHPEAAPAPEASAAPASVETHGLPVDHSSEGQGFSASRGEQAPEGLSEPPTPVVAAQDETAHQNELASQAPPGCLPADGPSTVSATSSEAKPAARWVAEKVELTAEEASLALEQEMQRQQACAKAQEAETNRDSAHGQATPEPEGTSPSGRTQDAVTEAPVEECRAQGAAAKDRFQPEEEPASQEAAAWKNWQQIRETVMNTQSTAIMPTVLEQSAPREDEPGGGAAELESAALASIVDTVLAELKPRLMEEIRKKLVPEKK